MIQDAIRFVQKLIHSIIVGIVSVIFTKEDADAQKHQNTSKSSEQLVEMGSHSVLQLIFEVMFPFLDPTPNYELAEKYGKMYGPRVVVKVPFYREVLLTLTDLNLCKKLMTTANWLNRVSTVHYLHITTFNKPLGLLFSGGDQWRQSSRLSLKILHQLDFFKANKMESFISYEIADVLNRLGKRVDRDGGELEMSPSQMFEVATLNIVCQVIMGTRFEHDDPIVADLLHLMNQANREFSLGASPLEFCRWLKYFPRLTYLGSIQRVSNAFYDYFKQIIEKRKKSGVYRENSNDFLNAFLQEIDKHDGEEYSYITEESLLAVMRDMVFAGADTTNSALEHGILHVSLDPRIQEKLQAEIDEFIGMSRVPTYEDKNRMVYTQAVLLEVLRVASPVPFSARSTDQDTQIGGYMIPKDSMAGINIYAIHRSEDLWQDPLVFRPERFLSEDGRIVNTEKILPFGYGKRICIGETVARSTLFIFFVSLFQKFSFRISDASPPPSMKNVFGLSRCPPPYHVKIRKRA